MCFLTLKFDRLLGEKTYKNGKQVIIFNLDVVCLVPLNKGKGDLGYYENTKAKFLIGCKYEFIECRAFQVRSFL